MNTLNWNLKKFSELSSDELYNIMQLRQRVFIIEQKCPYLDADGVDLKAYHLFGHTDVPNTYNPSTNSDNSYNHAANNHGTSNQNIFTTKLVAYLRILPPGLKYTEASLGRVVVDPAFRGQNIGRKLTLEGLKSIKILYGAGASVRISAQEYLEKFYTEFGFAKVGDVYMEDWIPHIEMHLKNSV